MPSHFLLVAEYAETARVSPSYASATWIFTLSAAEIATYVVRALLTAKASSGIGLRLSLAASVLNSNRFFIDAGSMPLRLSPFAKSDLRDFSFTSRLGELGQGISYAWFLNRGYIICDLAGVLPGMVGSKTPDYICLDIRSLRVILIETKATTESSAGGKMKKALLSCSSFAAGRHIPKSVQYGAVLQLCDSKLSTLHIKDPGESESFSFDEQYALFKRSYTSWFELSGDYDRAEECREVIWKGGVAVKNDAPPRRDIFRHEGSYDPASLTKEFSEGFIRGLGMDPLKTRFILDKEIDQALKSPEAFAEYQQGLSTSEGPLAARRLASEQYSNVRIVLSFPDGTSIGQVD